MNKNPYAKADGTIEFNLLDGKNCRVTGKPPIPQAEVGPEGPPWAVYVKSDGTLGQFNGNGKRRGNTSGERGPRTGAIPLSLIAAGMAMSAPLEIKEKDSDKVKAEKSLKNAAQTLAVWIGELPAVIPAQGGEKKTRDTKELAALWKKQKGVDHSDLVAFMDWAEKNKVYQEGGQEEREGTLVELAEKYPDAAAEIALKEVREHFDSAEAAVRDAIRTLSAQLNTAATA